MLIVNKDALNKYGEEIGYKIMPGRGSVHRLTIGNSTNLQNSGSIGYHDYFVTKQVGQPCASWVSLLDTDFVAERHRETISLCLERIRP